MTIDGYYVPTELAESVQARADQLSVTQHIGVLYAGKCASSEIATNAYNFRRDLEVGRFCSWVFGPSYEDLKATDNLAAILWFSPRRSA